MLVRLIKTHRRRAAWLIALAYLLCALAPTLSLALPGSQEIAHCLTVEDHTASAVQLHGKDMMQATRMGMPIVMPVAGCRRNLPARSP